MLMMFHLLHSALSGDATAVRLTSYVPTLPKDTSIVMFIGAMAHGPDDFGDGLVDDKISISEYPLSAAITCSKITNAFEELWGIL
jgi:rRNA small subunit pseudouridine methyltransferase Nep1